MTSTAATNRHPGRFAAFYAYDRCDRTVLATLRTKGLRAARVAYATRIGVPANRVPMLASMTIRQARQLPAFVALEEAAR